ncbi:potassium channel subfamily K member 13-like [Eriocheir sinensis]|uniref:potassium channel subfamily K member 13-like n=1 Tax=Eriocheir sinensis TaxID=95602 RepID=UPI0021C99A84|nr:potassium channel subfamily K member 13-like [Eriocheir sinensis]
MNALQSYSSDDESGGEAPALKVSPAPGAAWRGLTRLGQGRRVVVVSARLAGHWRGSWAAPGVGYGAAAPKTQKGKIFCIFYGLVGCSSGILFFNLFLERIITLLAFIMRRRHERNQRKRMAAIQRAQGVVENGQRRTSQDSMEDGSLSAWKPSVYWVMFYLSIASIIVAFLGAIMFMEVEEWTYENAIYFCFVSFSTIGFGDFVSAQRTATCCAGGQCTSAGRRNTVSPSRQQKLSIKRLDGDIDSVYGSETERKLSGEMVSMREYISTNKVSLAVMQKQLYETAQLG